MHRYTIYFVTVLATVLVLACSNPFSPKKADDDFDIPLISDQSTTEGIFNNFRYAYMFKDTLVYGQLLADDFTFIYRNYDLGSDFSWGRDEDMLTTYGLFNAAQSLDLIWNEIVMSVQDTVEGLHVHDIARSFILTITFSPSDIIRLQGKASFRLVRKDEDDDWKIQQWRDESNY